MCFHSKQTKKAIEVEHRFNAKIETIDAFQTAEHYNGFEFPKTPVITNEDSSKIQMIHWGLLPKWANEEFDKKNTLNARIETLSSKISFKNIINNRCIIIVNGFFEWQKIGKNKLKYEIGFHDELFAFAGLYDVNNGKKTYTIVTTEAQGIMREIHNTKLRMPFTLQTDEDFNNWLQQKEVVPKYNFSTLPKLYMQQKLFKKKI